MTTLHVRKPSMSDAEKQAAIAAALPKLEQMVKADQHIAPPAEMLKGPAIKDKVKAPMSMTGYGKGLAQDYLITLGKAGESWQKGILYLLKSCSDIQRNDAMNAAFKVAKSCKDELAGSNLIKRISEARRVFKAAQGKGTGKIVKAFEAEGSWHQKVAKLPTVTKQGRKPGSVKTPVISVADAMASVEKAGKLVGVAEGHSKVGVVKLGDVFGLVERLSIPDCLKVLDLCAGKIMVCKDANYAALGKELVTLRERQELAQRKAA